MKINWDAIGIGFVVTIVLGLVTSVIYAGTDGTLFASWGVIGVLGGLAAGLVAGGSMSDGAVHGGIATVFGSIITFVLVTFTTLLFAGVVPALGVVVVGVLLLALYAIPGAIGGAIASWAKVRRADRRMAGAKA